MGEKKHARSEQSAARLGDVERFHGMSEDTVVRITLTEHNAYQPVVTTEPIHRAVAAIQHIVGSDCAPHWTARAILERGFEYAMARSKAGTAEYWYDALIATYPPDAQEARALRERFRAFLIRSCAARALRRKGFTVSPEEHLVMARSTFRSSGHRAEYRNEYFAASVACSNANEITDVLTSAVVFGDDALATRAARALKRTLTRQELKQLASAKMQEQAADPERVAAFLQRHVLTECMLLHLERCIAADLPYATVTAVARRMRMKLTADQLVRLRERCMRSKRIDDAFAVTRALARRNPDHFGAKQRELHAWARDVELTRYSSITRAERHGQRCGKPLTRDELYAFLERYGSDSRYTEERDAALSLIARRIAKLLRT